MYPECTRQSFEIIANCLSWQGGKMVVTNYLFEKLVKLAVHALEPLFAPTLQIVDVVCSATTRSQRELNASRVLQH